MRLIYSYKLGTPGDLLDSGSYLADGISSLHDNILYYEILILVVVSWMLFFSIWSSFPYFSNSGGFSLKDFYFNSQLEIIWTIVPALILILIAIPSFRLLYLMNDIHSPSITIKVQGSQWFWNYSYNDQSFDSYMIKELTPGVNRLLDTDNYLILPSNCFIRFLITSSDVLHSFAVPALGIKVDAIPGRINSVGVEIYRTGLYYGQCSELCGIGHSYMPINIKVI